ncbi:hypothetical protein SAMN05443377_1485 [Propionibacterium cyclohexanicum]|uniref:Uncharacterized protein n=2 Tax=Propionibacterium cyclohexanicum TaxID=64702 RepID=A0A1H9U8U3_9ACTN|nr:hypothetical protein SAMN05443377_1485 [Propionibacterium cyclohexanicum]
MVGARWDVMMFGPCLLPAPQEALVRGFRDGVVRWCCCAVVVVSLGSAAGCGSSPPGAPPAAVSSGSATPSADVVVSASMSQAELDAEAERVYRAFFAEEQKVLLAGGAEELPESVKPYITGDFEKMIEAGFQEVHRNRWKLQPDRSAEIVALKPDHSLLSVEVLAALVTCSDSRSSGFLTSEGELLPGGIDYASLYFSRNTDGQLKVFNSKSEEVTACPLEG